jgi:hypothetical protein
MNVRKRVLAIGTVALLILLSMTALAATGRYDQQIQQAVSNKIQDAKQLQSVQASVEDGIVTLTGSVNLFQDKLDATKSEEGRERLWRSQHISRSRGKMCPMTSSSRNCLRSWPMTAWDISITV